MYKLLALAAAVGCAAMLPAQQDGTGPERPASQSQASGGPAATGSVVPRGNNGSGTGPERPASQSQASGDPAATGSVVPRGNSGVGKDSQFEKKLSGDQKILHALDRLTFGPRPGDIEAVKKMGLSKWIDQQLHPERIPEDEALTKLVAPLVEPANVAGIAAIALKVAIGGLQGQASLQQLLSREEIQLLRTGSDKEGLDLLATLPRDKVVQVLAAMPAVRPRLAPLLDADLRKRVELAAPTPPQPGQVLAQGKLLRAIRSDRQLEEVLVDFWYNHFNVDAGKGVARSMITAYEREAIRPDVLGKFRDLLGATANSP